MQITLPWPPSKLSPNARGHWRTKEDARENYKSQCYLLAKGKRPQVALTANIPLFISFHPPTKTSRDLDNCLASIKYGLDGLAKAWGVNDKYFRPITIDMGEPRKFGAVDISVMGAA